MSRVNVQAGSGAQICVCILFLVNWMPLNPGIFSTAFSVISGARTSVWQQGLLCVLPLGPICSVTHHSSRFLSRALACDLTITLPSSLWPVVWFWFSLCWLHVGIWQKEMRCVLSADILKSPQGKYWQMRNTSQMPPVDNCNKYVQTVFSSIPLN